MIGGFQVGPFQPAYQQIGTIGDTHDPGTQVIRESHLRKYLKKQARKLQRADLEAAQLVQRGLLPSSARQEGGARISALPSSWEADDERVITTYMAQEGELIDRLANAAELVISEIEDEDAKYH